MHIAYRLYLGARNAPERAFSSADRRAVEQVLDAFFRGWTTIRSEGCWLGRVEESLLITVTSSAVKEKGVACRETLDACAARLKALLGQESVMIEEGGPVSLL